MQVLIEIQYSQEFPYFSRRPLTRKHLNIDHVYRVIQREKGTFCSGVAAVATKKTIDQKKSPLTLQRSSLPNPQTVYQIHHRAKEKKSPVTLPTRQSPSLLPRASTNKAVHTTYVVPKRLKSESVTESVTDGPTDRRTDRRARKSLLLKLSVNATQRQTNKQTNNQTDNETDKETCKW